MTEPSEEALEWVYGALCEDRPTAWNPTTIRRVALALDKARAEERLSARKWAYDQRLSKFRSGCACHIDPDTDKLVNVCELHKDQVEQARAEEREECALVAKHLKGWGVVGVGAAAVAEHIAAAIRNRADRT